MINKSFLRSFYFVLIIAVIFQSSHSFTHPAPKTVGSPWPKPQSIQQTGETYKIDAQEFRIDVAEGGKDCDMLRSAMQRSVLHIFGSTASTTLKFRSLNEWLSEKNVQFHHSHRHSDADNEFTGATLTVVKQPETFLNKLSVYLSNDCEHYPHLGMNETYALIISDGSAELHASSIWGAMHGLETFSHCVYQGADGTYRVNKTNIIDFPRFSHRGVLLDSSRHFLSVEVLKQHLEAMSYNKYNVFHWHIVDDQSFPYQSRDFPNLSNEGAYHPYTHVYTQQDVAEIIEFARVRGIRVIPEFDSPGHTESWGKGQPNLLTKCYNKEKQFNGQYGPIDPSKDSSYDFLRGFMSEVADVFPDQYLHLGGDEVSFDCWKSNEDIGNFMKQNNITGYAKLEEFYMQKLLNIVGALEKGYIVWQEVLDNGVKVKPDTVVHVWLGKEMAEMAKVTKQGLRGILSSCWYLNYIKYGPDWKTFYKCDPQNFTGTPEQKALVIGGEMCMWGEFVDTTNVISRTWPRGSAVAERLWSSAKVTNITETAPRLEEHRCRMIRRGLQVEPVNGPGFCQHEFTAPPRRVEL